MASSSKMAASARPAIFFFAVAILSLSHSSSSAVAMPPPRCHPAVGCSAHGIFGDSLSLLTSFDGGSIPRASFHLRSRGIRSLCSAALASSSSSSSFSFRGYTEPKSALLLLLLLAAFSGGSTGTPVSQTRFSDARPSLYIPFVCGCSPRNSILKQKEWHYYFLLFLHALLPTMAVYSASVFRKFFALKDAAAPPARFPLMGTITRATGLS